MWLYDLYINKYDNDFIWVECSQELVKLPISMLNEECIKRIKQNKDININFSNEYECCRVNWRYKNLTIIFISGYYATIKYNDEFISLYISSLNLDLQDFINKKRELIPNNGFIKVKEKNKLATIVDNFMDSLYERFCK